MHKRDDGEITGENYVLNDQEIETLEDYLCNSSFGDQLPEAVAHLGRHLSDGPLFLPTAERRADMVMEARSLLWQEMSTCAVCDELDIDLTCKRYKISELPQKAFDVIIYWFIILLLLAKMVINRFWSVIHFCQKN